MVVLTTTTWYGGEQAVDGVYRHIIILSQHCINITIIAYIFANYILSVINIPKIFASYNTYTLPCSTPCVSCGCIDTQSLEFGFGSMQLPTELFATNIFQHDKKLPVDNVDCHALFLMNVPRNYHPALLPLSPLVQTVHPAIFLKWLYETFERMDNWMEGQEEEQNDAITLCALSPAGRECNLSIRNTDIRGWSS